MGAEAKNTAQCALGVNAFIDAEPGHGRSTHAL